MNVVREASLEPCAQSTVRVRARVHARVWRHVLDADPAPRSLKCKEWENCGQGELRAGRTEGGSVREMWLLEAVVRHECTSVILLFRREPNGQLLEEFDPLVRRGVRPLHGVRRPGDGVLPGVRTGDLPTDTSSTLDVGGSGIRPRPLFVSSVLTVTATAGSRLDPQPMAARRKAASVA